MGNERSQMSSVEIDQRAVEVTDFYAHYAATLNNGSNPVNLSVFVGEPLVGGTLWQTQTPLEKASKNLMLYRHPCILKYVSSWGKGSKFYLAVEDVKPLAHVLPTLNSLHICIGLHSILKALCFLHEKALVSHNNVCTASIYVAKDGSWKLGGMEYLCKFTELSADYLSKTRNTRYDKAIDPNEDKVLKDNKTRKDTVDVFAFGVLACEVLKRHTDENLPSLTPFLQLCKSNLQNVDAAQRPKLNVLLQNPFFNHDFINVHTFLIELPLKSDTEKEHFFTTLLDTLKIFDEHSVATQLSGLLLSRLVLLNKMAQQKLLPGVLCPRKDEEEDKLFSKENFKKFLTPKLLDVICVRDAEIRKVLLNYFSDFLDCFSNQELQEQVLPELLVGIKDTNDQLVAATLRSLADLVPVLGASTVIGGKRAKLFNDGKPLAHTIKQSRPSPRIVKDTVPLPVLQNSASDINDGSSNGTEELPFPERPRPDGEEVDMSTDEVEQSAEEETDVWEDWDVAGNTNEDQQGSSVTVTNDSSYTVSENLTSSDLQSISSSITETTASVNIKERPSKKSLPDIFELDIKNQQSGELGRGEDFDFFQDMEPVIESSTKFVVREEINDVVNEKLSKLNLAVASDGVDNEDGWGDEEW